MRTLLLDGGPIAGLLVGAVAGALVGASVKLGIDQKFVKEMGEDLQPGTSALFFIGAALEPYKVPYAIPPSQRRLRTSCAASRASGFESGRRSVEERYAFGYPGLLG